MRTDEQVTAFSNRIADEAWIGMNAAAADWKNAGNGDGECDVNLYVYEDGTWTITGAQYLTDHRRIVSVVPLMLVNGPNELAEIIEQEYEEV